jgi:DnaJ-domain-containing protein 1
VPVLNDLNVSVTERQFGRAQGGPINLSRAELCRARLDQATLTEANLMGAVLTEADLSDARLEKANLRGAKLAYASLDGARLNGANLCAADLRQARGLTQAQIDQGVGDHRTSLPTNLTTPRAWLQNGLPQRGQGAGQTERAADVANDETADPHAILGVSPGASMQAVRVAWVNLVKDLYHDRSSGELLMRERLKSINRAYQELKERERQAKQRQGSPGILRSSRIAFAAVLAAAIAVGALVAMILEQAVG